MQNKVEGLQIFDLEKLRVFCLNFYNKVDLELFKKQIFPFVKHSKKRRETEELMSGYLVRDCYKPLVKLISENQGITQKKISKKICRVKCHAKLKALIDAGFIERERDKVDESFKYRAAFSALKWIEGA